MNLVDLVILFLLAMGALNGFKKGLLNSLIGLLSTVLGLFVATKFYPYLADWVEAKYKVVEKMGTFFAEKFTLPQGVSQLKIGTNGVPDFSMLIDKLNLSPDLKNQLLEAFSTISDKLASTANSNAGDVLGVCLAETIVKFAAIFVIWQVVTVIAIFLANFITNLTQGTFLGTLNRLGGLSFGALVTMITITIVFGLMNPFLELAQHTEQSSITALAKTISESSLVPYLTSTFSFCSKLIRETIGIPGVI